MTGQEGLRRKISSVIQERSGELNLDVGTDIGPTSLEIAELAIEYFRTIHSRALACHCECLGMNAENMWAAIANQSPVYVSNHYYQIMQKWGLVNEKGEPLI